MHTTNLSKSRKAISPILATLLLIVIAVAAIVVTYAWIMTYMSNAGQQAGVQLYKSNVRFYTQGSTKMISIDVGNSGTANTEIIKVYAGASSGNRTEQTPTQALPIALAKSSIVTIAFTYTWTAHDTYYFKVVSSSGQTLEWPDQAETS